VITKVRDIRRTGCAVVDFTWLALGRTDAYYERGLNPWDVAAGLIVAQEAGATIVDFGDAHNGGNFLVAVPGIAEQMREALTEAGFPGSVD